MKLWESPLRSIRSAAVLAAALGALASANSLANGFAYDDIHIVVQNRGIQSLETLPQALREPYWPGVFGQQLGLWRPTTTLVLGLQYTMVGDNPVLYHAVNVLAHAAATALVVLLLAQLMSPPAALVGGLVFAVHPVHVEAVANVVGIAEILPALFFLVACLLHLRGPRETGWGWALGIGALYALAFGGKESAVTLPGAVFLLDAARERLSIRELPTYLRRRWRAYLVLIGVAGAMLWARMAILGSIASPFAPLGAELLAEIPRIWTVAEVWSHYVRLLVFPLDLASDYAPNVIPISIGWNAANTVGAVLALGILAGAWAAWRKPELRAGSESARAVGFGVVWFLVTISPVANVVFLSGVLLAERNLYLPSVGFAAAMGWLVVRLARDRRRAAWAGLGLVVALMGLRTWLRNPTWEDNDAVFETLIAEYPYSGRAQWVLGDQFYQLGQTRQALVSYRAAVGLLGSGYQIITEIAKKLQGAGYDQAAERLLLQAWRDRPEFGLAPGQLGVLYNKQGRPQEVERFCRISLTVGGPDAVCYHLLAGALAQQARWSEAVEARKAAIQQGEAEHWQQWVSLAELQAHAGDTAAALATLDSAAVRAGSPGGREQVDSLRVVFGTRDAAAGPATPGR